MPNLFVDASTGGLKPSMGMHLSDDSAKWQEEILQEFVRRHPYTGAYQQGLEVLSGDTQRGYMYGQLTLSPPPVGQPMPGKMAGPPAPEKLVQIPFVVGDYQLRPMDVFIDTSGEFRPLNERRLSTELVSETPAALAPAPAVPPGAPSQTRPPIYGEAGGMQAGGFANTRYASTMLETIAPTMDLEDQRRFVDTVQSNPALLALYAENEAFTRCAHVIDTAQPLDPDLQAARIVKSLPADAIQFRRTADGYVMKSACADAFSVQEDHIPKKYASTLPEGVLQRLLAGETPTFVREGAPVCTDSPDLTPIDKFASARVHTMEGPEVGHVVPSVWGGGPHRRLFVSPRGYAYCEEAYGDFAKEAAAPELPQVAPHGLGCFVRVDEGGVPVECTRPLLIKAAMLHGDETHYAAEVDGAPVRVIPTPMLTKFAATGGVWLVPQDVSFFMPLPGKELLPRDPALARAAGETSKAAATLVLRFDGAHYFGGEPAIGLPQSFRDGVSAADALLALGTYGIPEKTALAKIAEAEHHGMTTVSVRRPVKAYEMVKTAASASATRLCEELRPRVAAVRVDMIKLAAQIPDAATVDSVLSLGFVNPQNMASFVDAVPQFETALSKLCELLMLARIGESQIPEESLQQGIQQVDSVIQALQGVGTTEGVA